MERRVTVNDGIERLEIEAPDFPPSEEGSEDSGAAFEPEAAGHGPCLYLGPRGERCGRPAVAGGYCARHHSDPELRSSGRNYTRVLVASVALILVIWPYLSDVIRELFRWLGSRSAGAP